jgi:hypothetical protein
MPDISTLPDLADCLGVTVDELLKAEKKEETRIKVEEVANEKNLINIFNICFAVSAFFCTFGALLGGFTEIYSTLNFKVLFYNHWEIIFAAVSFFAIVLGNLFFYMAAIRLNMIYSKKKIIKRIYKKAIFLAFMSYLFAGLFLVRIIDHFFWLYITEYTVFLLLTVALAIICRFIADKAEKRFGGDESEE